MPWETAALEKGNAAMTLFDLVSGDRARIVRICGGGPKSIRQRLLDMGVTKDTEVRVERHAPLGDPVEVTIKGYYLALRMSEAQDIEVEPLPSPECGNCPPQQRRRWRGGRA